jgi:PTH1 family peptidyl-tRNA hydrolase
MISFLKNLFSSKKDHPMYLIVGLGNPGTKYQNTRHNIGFMAIDHMIQRFSLPTEEKKFNGLVSRGDINGTKIVCLKPQTYMNLSGQSVAKAMAFYKIPLERVIVLHDDIDLKPNTLKIKQGGGAGGHNGLKHIDQLCGKNYHRIRLGVGRPANPKFDVSRYVLASFDKNETWVNDSLSKATDHTINLMNNLSTKKIEKS